MKNPSETIFTYSEINALRAQGAPLDSFGPGSELPLIVFETGEPNPKLDNWLMGLPCPLIGIGTTTDACDVILPDTAKLGAIIRNVKAAPIAAMTLVQHLRASEHLPMDKALIAESFAYGTLQQGPEFKVWQKSYKGGNLSAENGPPLMTDISDDALKIRLNRPKNYNAIGVEMRDALCEILDMALLNDGFETIEITGAGRTFSIGGAIQEFGEVSDPATAHWIRSLRLPATRLAKLSDKLRVHVNGAAIGAGVEIAAFAGHVTAAPKAWFQLPELKYGLIPGAGGTVSISRRIGRQRCAYMALSMEKITAETALEWGLVDGVRKELI